MLPKEAETCTLCGRTQEQVQTLLKFPSGAAICDTCAEEAHQITRLSRSDRPCVIIDSFPIPEEIKRQLDDYIIGQDEPKRRVAVAVYNHYKRVNARIQPSPVELEKSNILYEIPSRKDIVEVILTPEVIREGRPPRYILAEQKISA